MSSNYAYVCARVKSKKAFLFKPDVYPKLLVMSIPEITRFIGESQYKKETEELALKYSGSDLTEYALSLNLARTFQQICGYCKGELKILISKWLEHWDVWNIKTVLRGKFYGAKEEEIEKTIIAAGSYHAQFWQALIANNRTIDEVIAGLRRSEYYPVLMNVRKRMDKITSLMEFENELELYYYQMLQNTILPTSKANQLFLDFVKKELDIQNLKTLFMLKYENVEHEKIARMLIHGGKELPMRKLHTILPLSFEQFTTALREFAFYPDIKEAVEAIPSTKALSPVIRALEKHHIRYSERFSHLHPVSVIPVLDYLIRKKVEVDNIRIIVRGKESELPEQAINDLLILP